MPSASEIHAVCRTQVPKRRSSCSKENLLLAKVPKIEHLVKSELIDGQKQGNIIHILKEQNVNVKLVKREDSTESKKEKTIKPKTPAGRVLVSLGGEVGCGKVLANYLTKSHRKSTDEVASFILFIHERQKIFELKNSGSCPPYTENKVMAEKWFTNMYRELDRGTMYFRKNILEEHVPLCPGNYPEIVFKAVAYRLVNKIETFEKFGGLPRISDWKTFKKFLTKTMDAGEVIFTSAHQNMGLNRFCDTMKEVLKNIDEFTNKIVGSDSLEDCFDTLKSITNIGDFFAWQICCDFLELKLISFDENTWTCLGPGAKAGLKRIFSVNPDRDGLELAQKLTKIMDYGFKALNLDFPYFLNRKLTLKNIEHALCEYDKYFRAALNMPTRERFFHSRSSTLDITNCMDCDKRLSGSSSSTKCVLCGSSFHMKCLRSDFVTGLVEDRWWLCLMCHQVDAGDLVEDDRVFLYEEVKDVYKIRPVNVLIKSIKC